MFVFRLLIADRGAFVCDRFEHVVTELGQCGVRVWSPEAGGLSIRVIRRMDTDSSPGPVSAVVGR